jgi:glycolate oxidase FAD binding subunit
MKRLSIMPIMPTTTEELAEILAHASAEGQPVVPYGAGLHQHLGGVLPEQAIHLNTTGLNRVIEHAPADLIVQVEAGVRLAELQRMLGEHGQWLPWDPPAGANATIGGLLAAGRSGPLRLGYGTPRDWLLGATVVLGDGRITKSGGKVVKNVAGYDNHKLHIGAFGTLGVLTNLTFKLNPKPEQDATLWAGYPDLHTACTIAEQLRARPLSPASIAIIVGSDIGTFTPTASPDSIVVLMHTMGIAASVARHVDVATSLGLRMIADAAQVWQNISDVATPKQGDFILRAGVRPAATQELLAALRLHAPTGHTTVAYPGVGVAYSRWVATSDHNHRLTELRKALFPHDGYVVVEATPELIATDVRWGPPPATLAIMQRLKQHWDPAGILNPGRYLV